MHFKDSTYYTATGKSEVVVHHKGKDYHGYAYLHPDDKDRESQFTGCRYAEMRAQIKALKAEYKEEKTACEECRKFIHALECYKNWDKTNVHARLAYRQLDRKIKEVNLLADKINELEFSLKVSIRQRDAFVKKIEEKHKND